LFFPIENKLLVTIGDNPVYMAVTDPQNVEEEHLFVNPIYGGPDPALYAKQEPNTNSNQQIQVGSSTSRIETPNGLSSVPSMRAGNSRLGDTIAEYAVPVKKSLSTNKSQKHLLNEGLILTQTNKPDLEPEAQAQETTKYSVKGYSEISQDSKKMSREKQPGFHSSSTSFPPTTSKKTKKPLLPLSGNFGASHMKSISTPSEKQTPSVVKI